MTLFPIQAVSVKEAWENQGLVAGIKVGGGKTLLSLLLPRVLESERPMLVLPAKLIGKTVKERAELAIHWQIPNHTKIKSYEILGRVQAKEELERFAPDLLIFDEAHKLKNPKAAVTRRVGRYIKDRRKAKLPLRVVVMTGTLTSRSIKDYAHLIEWALPNGCPLPLSWVEREDWANALDDLANPFARVDPGALLEFWAPEDGPLTDLGLGLDLGPVRRAYSRRLTDTPGVVSSGSDTLGSSLSIDAVEALPSAPIDTAFELLRREAMLPDGWECIDGVEVWAAARQLALGFFYVWSPRPPAPWSEARSVWAKFAREAIKNSRTPPLDSELDVALAYPDVPERRGWVKIRDTFKPNPVPVWICDSAVRLCADWMSNHPQGIVWVDHVAFGEALEICTGVPYYREMGCDKQGRPIESARGSVIASTASNRDGRNLQAWKDNLIMGGPSSGLHYEQLLGRTHRTGQEAEEVTATVYMGCLEHAEAFQKAVVSAQYEQDTTRQSMKLCYADVLINPLDTAVKSGPRWQKL